LANLLEANIPFPDCSVKVIIPEYSDSVNLGDDINRWINDGRVIKRITSSRIELGGFESRRAGPIGPS